MLHHVHLDDADGHADRRWNAGEGTIAWRAAFRALAKLGGNPRFILDARDKETVRAGAGHLIALGVSNDRGAAIGC